MVLKKIFASSLVALALAFAAPVSLAQDMGGGGDEEKKPEEKPAETPPAEPKPDAGKPAEPKVKTLAFDKNEKWKEAGAGRRGNFKAFKVDVEGEEAHVHVIHLGAKADWEKELERWAGQFEDKDGKKLEKSALKVDGFDTTGGLKVKQAEASGTAMVMPPRQRGKKGEEPKEAPKPEKKPGQKLVACYVEGGPDGVWLAKLFGPEKAVDKTREDFTKFVKSAHEAEKAPEAERPKREKKKPSE